MNKLKQALKDDFKKLYQPQFTTTWEAERLVRETEIDVMELQAIEAYIAEIRKEPIQIEIEHYERGMIERRNTIMLTPEDEWKIDFQNPRHEYMTVKRLDHLSKKDKDE